MKSTYQLLSIFLDGKNLPGIIPKLSVAEDFDAYPDISEGTTLFAYPRCICKVSGKYLLSHNSIEPIINSIDQLLVCLATASNHFADTR